MPTEQPPPLPDSCEPDESEEAADARPARSAQPVAGAGITVIPPELAAVPESTGMELPGESASGDASDGAIDSALPGPAGVLSVADAGGSEPGGRTAVAGELVPAPVGGDGTGGAGGSRDGLASATTGIAANAWAAAAAGVV